MVQQSLHKTAGGSRSLLMGGLGIKLGLEAEKCIPYLFKFLASVQPLNSSNFKPGDL